MSKVESYCWLRGYSDHGRPILYCADWQHKGEPKLELQQLPITFICSFQQPMLGRHLSEQQRQLAAKFPAWDVLVGAPTPRLVREAANPNVILWSDAWLVRDDFWTPTYDSVFYSAVTAISWAPYNKHELLAKAVRVLIVSPNNTEFREREDALKQGLYTNYFVSLRGRGWLDPEITRAYYAQAACGLSLSDFDNGARMVAELQLMGLPIVSIPSRVGTLQGCDPEFVRIVPPDPDSVGLAIHHLEDQHLDPHIVRESYLEWLMAARANLANRLGPIPWDIVPFNPPQQDPSLWIMPHPV